MPRANLLRYVRPITGRDGVVRYYFRRRGHKDVRLPGPFAGEAFMAAYAAALGNAEPFEIGAKRAKAGTIAAVVGLYLASAAFAGLALETRRTRRSILERLREQHGDKPIALIERKHVKAMVDAKAATPSAARNLLRVLRPLMAFAIENSFRSDDPTIGVKHAPIKTDGYDTWSEDDIAAFEAHHPIGTKALLAFALLLHTVQRRGDVVRMSRRDLRGDKISVKQSKTGKALMLPIDPELRAAIDAMPADHLVFLTTERGEPYKPAAFTNWFRSQCNAAGIRKGLSAHGLRKAGCRRYAEAGCSANEIAAISGHTSLREVARYTKAADQERMASAAMRRLRGAS
jgi:integrase